jgi:drug/metabolite transporter (DMT)-like permease
MNLQPVVGLALAALVLAEPLTAWQLIGGSFVLAGVALTTRR